LNEPGIPLSWLMRSEEGRILRIEGSVAQQLSGFGLYPGALIQVQQRFPSYIIKTDQTELALEHDIAQRIMVLKL
jgi:Fe2+ transport system protein FeoA